MKKIIILILCFTSYIGLSQKNFVAGSISLPSGRSEIGFIDYREWRMNPQYILFKKLSGVWVDYTSNDILEFRIDSKNEIYKQAIFDKTFNINNAKERNLDKRLNPKAIFLLTLIKGKINLYSFRDADDEPHYFIQKEDAEIYELINRPHEKTANTTINSSQTSSYKIITYSEEYKKQLLSMMSDYPELAQDIQNLFLDYKSIFNLVKKYNLKKGDLTYQKSDDKISKSLFGYIGYTQSNIVFEEFYTGWNQISRINAYSPTFGLGYEWGMARTNEKLAMGVETTLQQNKVEFSLTTKGVKNDYLLDINGLRLGIYGKYILHKGNVQPYIKGGIGATAFFTSSFKTNKENAPAKNERINNLAKSEQFLLSALGVKIHSFFFESRYEIGTNLNNKAGENLNMNRISLVAGFSLKLNK